MYLTIITLPLLSALFSGFFGFLFGKKGSQIITTTSLFISCLFSIHAFLFIINNGVIIHIPLFTWISSGLFQCQWGLYLDSLTVVMLIVVTSISTCVHFYSIEYMSHDPHIPRFMSYLSLFTFFMLMLVTSDNFIQLFFGWEGVGLCSYLLINFWFSRIDANKAAIKAIILNRIGDFGFTLAILALFYTFNSIDFCTIFATVQLLYLKHLSITLFSIPIELYTFIGFFLFLGAIGKSAQIGLHTWLPDAMEGPTPVSALIHAATMVTAGVFLLIRSSPFFEFVPNILIFITLIGSITAFFGATSGLFQFDLKKIVAYSTCSQLGYMVFGCGLSAYSISLFHLFNHAFFKALLFLSCGSVIHALHDQQDLRKMGNLIQILPFTAILFLIGSLALMGFPFLSGFYSKDLLIEIAFAKYTFHGTFAHWLATFSAFFTAFYSMRLFYLVFIAPNNSYKNSIQMAHDAPIIMAIPLFILAIASIFIGYICKDLFVGLGTDFFQHSIITLPQNLVILNSEFIPFYIKIIPFIFTIFGATLAYIIYHFPEYFNLNITLFTFFNQKWHWDNIFNHFIAKPFLYIAYKHTYLTVDRGFLEIFGPTGLIKFFTSITHSLQSIHTGFIFHYIFIFTLFLTLFFSLHLLSTHSFFIILFLFTFIFQSVTK